MAEAIFPLISALVACALCVMVLLSRQRQRDLQKSSAALIGRRLLKPRAPADCPACRRQCAHAASPPVQPSSVPPWRALKRRRGAPHASPPTGLPVPTTPAAIMASPTRRFTPASATARTRRFRRFAGKPAERPSPRAVIPHFITSRHRPGESRKSYVHSPKGARSLRPRAWLGTAKVQS